jgi:parallel beta-helix repeat protein
MIKVLGMKNKMHYSIFVFFILIINFSAIPIDNILSYEKFNTGGDILYVGCEDNGCYPTIQSAIIAAKSGDTIFVFDDSSPYNENIVVDKSLNILGENKETTIIDGRNNGNVVYISADEVNISNFTIRSSGNDAGITINSDNNFIINNYFKNDYYGLRISSAHFNTIQENKFENCEYAIYSFDSNNNEILENIIIENTIGIKLMQNSNENNFYRNVVSLCDEAVSIDYSSYNNIYWNVLNDCIYGIYSSDSSYNKIYNKNTIIDNKYGIFLYKSDYCSIYDDNIISYNKKYGVYLFDSTKANIHENKIDNNEIGIFLNSSSGNNIYWNDVEFNINGLFLRYSSMNNLYLNNIENNFQFGINMLFCVNSKISYNNFISNYVSAYFKQSFINFNSWNKNYWDDWGGNGFHRVYGDIDGIILIENWFMFDMRPVEIPYSI